MYKRESGSRHAATRPAFRGYMQEPLEARYGAPLAIGLVAFVFAAAASAAWILLVGDIGELFFVVWLIVKGVRVPAAEAAGASIAA